MANNIGYHTRLYSDNTRKIVGGSFGGSINLETANRLVNRHFSVKVLSSGNSVFVDREGREVRLYMSVDPEMTDKGKEAVVLWREERARRQAEDAERYRAEQEEIEQLLACLSHDEAVRRLTRNTEQEG